MKRKQNKIIFGSVFGLAALAVAIDYTRHSLPEAEPQQPGNADSAYGEEGPCTLESPCSIEAYLRRLDDLTSPCTLESPCSLDESPCGLDDSSSPCSMDENPCSLDDSYSPCGLG